MLVAMRHVLVVRSLHGRTRSQTRPGGLKTQRPGLDTSSSLLGMGRNTLLDHPVKQASETMVPDQSVQGDGAMSWKIATFMHEPAQRPHPGDHPHITPR